MQIIWRTLPKLVLPAAIGLGIAYLATGFVPRPAPNLRPPEDLRAQGQAYAEESPVRIILERNVLKLESSPFFPLGQPPAPIAAPEAPAPPPASPPAPTQAAFAQADTSLTPKGPLSPAASPQAALDPQISATAPLSGGHSVQGQAVRPAVAFPPAAPGAIMPAAQAQAVPGPASSPAAKALASPASPPKPKAPDQADAPAVQAAPRLGLQGFRLVGVIAGGERPLAMLQVDGASVSLRIGEAARGWTLVSVEPGQVLLQSGAEQRRLMLGGAGPAQRAKAP